MIPTLLPSIVTNSNRRKMPSTSYAKLKNKINYSSPSHKMQTSMWDPLTTNSSMWDYLKKYKNNRTTSSLPQKTRSNASQGKRIWTKGPATLNPLN